LTPGVYITVDVECSMGGAWGNPKLRPVPPSRAIWGDYDGRRLGVPRIVEILGEYGLAATFFVEPFTDEQGWPGEMEPVCTYLLDHGQDVQLHIHPNHKHYGLIRQGVECGRTDQMADLEPGRQRELIEEGAERLARWTGRRPVAFRAGNMGASEATLGAVAAAGLRIDSSYTFVYAGGQCRFPPGDPYNGTRWYGDVLELALSGFRQPRMPGLHRAKPVDLVGICLGECRDAIERIAEAGAEAVAILHSFSLFKVRNVQYHGGRPNRVVTRRLRGLCRWLASAEDAHPVRTVAELAEAVERGDFEASAVAPPALGRPWRALRRKAVQAVNNLHWT